jgi:hypothetical protein
MPITFTRVSINFRFLRPLLFGFLVLTASLSLAQKDSLVKPATADTASTGAATHKPVTSVRPKEITKLEETNIPGEMYAKIKNMKPNELVTFRENFTYNIKAEDNIEYSITVKLGFSQDMITGIIKWVPLYASNDAPPEITQIKIPIKFCCTTPIDTLHKKQHCGKMSELNDFEDYEHCKDWKQAEDAGKGDKAAIINKKGKGVSKTDSTESFGKAQKPLSKKEMKKKKGQPGFGDDSSDSTGVSKDSLAADYGKPEKPSKKDIKKKKGKETAVEEPSNTADSSANPAPAPKEKSDYGKPVKESKKKKGKETVVEEPSNTADSSAKPAPAPKEKNDYGKPVKESKKKKGKEKEPEPPPATDSTSSKPEPPPTPTEKKDEEVKKDSADGGGFGKPEDKKSKKKKKG